MSSQHSVIFHPTHDARDNGLTPWKVKGAVIGYARLASSPKNVWLLVHGNAGQAADRVYALDCFARNDSVFILEYPGYGARAGKPSKSSFDAAAREAYQVLRKTFPTNPVCVVGESVGSGPACMLATLSPPPDKIVLLVPFDTLESVASEYVGSSSAGFLEADWDNISSLSNYGGSVEIFGAQDDRVIPIAHARRLAESVPQTKFHAVPGGHNEWSTGGWVQIRNP